jgi:hypothetical protein
MSYVSEFGGTEDTKRGKQNLDKLREISTANVIK